jgi:hypothetical protein
MAIIFATSFEDAAGGSQTTAGFPTIRSGTTHSGESGTINWQNGIDPFTDAAVGTSGDGVSTGQTGGTTKKDEIIGPANFSGGIGGKGFRHWRTGNNGHGGGITCTFTSSTQELWMRFYMRYPLSYTYGGSYTKDIYGNEGGDYWIYGMQTSHWGLTHAGDPNLGGSIDFADLFDGNFHCHEIHVKRGNPGSDILEIWIDDVLDYSASNRSFDTSAMTHFVLGHNQADAGAGEVYVDYDDIVVSNSERVGPISGGGGGGIIRGSMLGGLG